MDEDLPADEDIQAPPLPSTRAIDAVVGGMHELTAPSLELPPAAVSLIDDPAEAVRRAFVLMWKKQSNFARMTDHRVLPKTLSRMSVRIRTRHSALRPPNRLQQAGIQRSPRLALYPRRVAQGIQRRETKCIP
jgi:hypothetical protein